jgi:hypothetical protein
MNEKIWRLSCALMVLYPYWFLLYTWFVMRCQAFEVSLKKPCCVQSFFVYQAIFAKSAKSFVALAYAVLDK